MRSLCAVPVPGLDECLTRLEPLHSHLCPRQVLGARMGLYASDLLSLELPQRDKRLLTLVESDGCFADGIAVATGCSIGHRTLRVEDYGKVAAVFVDTEASYAVRVWPHPNARARAALQARPSTSQWQAQLDAYCVMPAGELLRVAWVALAVPAATIVGRPGLRVSCVRCGEEIMNGREVLLTGQPYCRGCLGRRYYKSLGIAERPSQLLARGALARE